MNDAYLFAGFIVTEVVFHHAERWLEHHKDKVRQVRYFGWCAWCIHPAVSDAASHYATHWVATILGH